MPNTSRVSHLFTKRISSLLFFLFITSSLWAETKDLQVINLSELNLEGKNHVCVRFSEAIATQGIQSYFSISKKDGKQEGGAWLLSGKDKLACYSNTEPNTAYEVSVYKQLPAQSGRKLSKTYHNTINTRHLEPAVSFDTRGSVLIPDISQGLPVASVNVDEVDITFHRVKPENREEVFNEIGSSYTYSLTRMLPMVSNLAYTGRFAMNAEKNRRTQRTIKIADISELQEPGLYLAAMKPAGTYNESPQITHFTVTDLGLHVRFYAEQLDVYVNGLSDAKAVEGVQLSLVDSNGQILKQTQTSAEGFASFRSPSNKAVLLVAEKDQHQSLLRLNGPALDLSEFQLGDRTQDAQTLFIYSERDIYRPGETVHFNALLRNQDGQLEAAPALKARLLQPDGQTVRRFTLTAGNLGYYEQSSEIPVSAPTGAWQLEIDKPDGKTAVYDFKVEEFLPERMELVFNNGKRELKTLGSKQTLQTSVKGDYLYGAPANGNRLSTQLKISHWRSPIEALKGYQFGDILEQSSLGTYELADQTLDENGETQVTSESRWQTAKSPLKLRLLSSLYESGGRPVTRSHDQLMWPREAHIGIKPEFAEDTNPPADSRVRFDVVRANLKGEKLAAKDLQVKLIREDRQYFWEYSDGQGWHYNYSEQEYPVSEELLDISPGKYGKVEVPVEWGNYRLEISDTSNDTRSSVRFFAGTDWYSAREASAQSSRPDVVGLSFDKPGYQPGDTAQLTIKPPHAGEALILVESNEPLWTHRVAVDPKGTDVSIPVSEDWNRHDIHVSVVVLRPASKVASMTPKRAFGLLHLPLDRQNRQVSIHLSHPEKVEPNKTLTTKIHLENTKPGKSYNVTLAAVDVGILNLTDFETPNPHEGFFERRRYNIDSRDLYGALIELNEFDTATLKFGGDAPSKGGKSPASDIQLVSLYSGPVEVDAEGVADVEFSIPDFNGRLRLMAVAFSDDEFGSSDSEVTVAAPVVTQLSMPRFLASRDAAMLALDVQNMSGKPQKLKVNLTADGPLSLHNGNRVVSLGDGEKQTLQIPITSEYGASKGALNLSVTGDSIEFQRDWSLFVRPPFPLQKEKQLVEIAPGQSIKFDTTFSNQLLPQGRNDVLSIDNQVDLGAKRQMKSLFQYPYGCLEQTSSRAWPWVFATTENTRKFRLDDLELSQRPKHIEKALQSLESKQLSNGAFGLWNNRSPEEHWLTAYVAELMLDAEKMGFPVQPEMKNAAFERLEAYLRDANMGYSRYTENNGHYRFAYRSYAAYVLSRVNRANLGHLRSLLDHQAEDAKSGLPLIHLGLALGKQGDQVRAKRAIEQGLQISRDDKVFLGDYGSAIRDNALMVRLLINHPEFGAAVSGKLSSLANQILDKQYLSTQEKNAIFLAAEALNQKGQTTWTADLGLMDQLMSLKQSGPYVRDLSMNELSSGIGITNSSKQSLWGSLTIQGYPKKAPAPESKGYTIERKYYDREGQPLSISRLDTGDLVFVHLKIQSDERMPDTLVVDMLPAGLELENQNLEHSLKLDDFKIDGRPLAELMGETEIIHQEFRDDRYVAAIDQGSYYQHSHLFYLARAVTPGTYQVPPPFVEDMYRPEKRAVGSSPKMMTINSPRQ